MKGKRTDLEATTETTQAEKEKRLARFAGPGGINTRSTKTVTLDELQATKLDRRVELLRYKAAYMADELADEIIRLLDVAKRSPKASVAAKKAYYEIKTLAVPFGIFHDKASLSADASSVVLRFPAAALDAMRIGVAITTKADTHQTPTSSEPTEDQLNQ